MMAPICPSPLQRGRGSSPQASGERGLQGIENARQHPLFIVEDVGVPEARDSEALRFQIGVATGIACASGVLAAVSLDDQPPLETNEIDYVVVDRQLSLELEAGETLRAEDLPEAEFSRGGLAAHLLRTF